MHEETYETGFRNQNYFLYFRVGHYKCEVFKPHHQEINE